MSIGFLVAVTGAGYIVDAIKASTGNETLGYSRMYMLMIVPIALALVYFFATKKKIRKAIEAVEK
jgi:TRAP-type C4-dicarboxylate transport system permease small subunit